MSIDGNQFRELVKDVLQYLDPEIPYSEAAVELLMLTAAAESRMGKWIRQVRGPALGVMQMEPSTDRDIWLNFLSIKPKLLSKIKGITGLGLDGTSLDPLRHDLAYQIAMARILYWRKPDPLPDAHEAGKLADYWKKHYNTYLGKGEAAKAVKYYKEFAL